MMKSFSYISFLFDRQWDLFYNLECSVLLSDVKPVTVMASY